MKLPREYRKFIGKYSACTNAYGRKMLRKVGYGPETEVVKEVKTESKPKAKKKRTKKVK